jgi:hypothetical protein
MAADSGDKRIEQHKDAAKNTADNIITRNTAGTITIFAITADGDVILK